MRDHRFFYRILRRRKILYHPGNRISYCVWYVDTGVAKANPCVGCCEGHVGTGLHIHTVEYSSTQIAPCIFQSLLAPEITDRIAADVNLALLRFMSRSGIIWPTGVRFERVCKHVEAWICSCHGW